jgi:HEAT repeat protein
MRSVLPALLLAALIGLAGCGSPSRANPAPPKDDAQAPPVDLELMRQLGKTHQQYVDALLLCGSPNPGDWERARRQLEVIHGYRVFDEDPELIKQFRNGDEKSRKELGRRGLILNSLMVFAKGYDQKKWDEAHKTLMDAGQPGQILLSTTLVEILMNGQFRDVWDHVRATLVDTGPVGYETLSGWAKSLAERTPADMPIYRIDDLTQAIVALIWFGDKARPLVDEFAASPKPNVRRASARAIGESVNAVSMPILVRMVSDDPDWTVRTAAATSMGRMSAAKQTAGPALLARMKKERDPMVLRSILESLGTLKYDGAVPDLVNALDVPNLEVASQAMNALYHITGERLTRKEQWLQWYATVYPKWKNRTQR